MTTVSYDEIYQLAIELRKERNEARRWARKMKWERDLLAARVRQLEGLDDGYNYAADDFAFDAARERAVFGGTRGRD